MTTFIRRFETKGSGIRLAIKDLIDMEGYPTTAGCKAVEESAKPAMRDAACLKGARDAGARIVGRTNLHELALGVTGINPWFGTPVNPLDAARIPGGSSSGSAVAVATGEADVAYGSDSGGSIRLPSACCGTSGLKTTWGRISLDGVWPLAPNFDTIGPMARDISGVIEGMKLLEPGFAVATTTPQTVGRLHVPCDPLIDAAIDRACEMSRWHIKDVSLPDWDAANEACALLLVVEAWHTDQELAERKPDKIGQDVLTRLHLGRDLPEEEVLAARATAERWRERLRALFQDIDLLVTPTLTIVPPLIENAHDLLPGHARCTLPANLAGTPALAMPIPSEGPLPASLQLMGPPGSEEQLLAAGLHVEKALAKPLH